MSSPDPPQLRLSLPSTATTFKRSFEQFGFDLENPVDSTLVASSSGTDEHRPGPSNSDRNKRARSSSVTPNSAERPRSMETPPSSSSSHTISSTSSIHSITNHRDAPPPPSATRHPHALENDSSFSSSSSLGGELPHTSPGLFRARSPEPSPVEPPTSTVWSNPPSSTISSTENNDQFRLSMERFHAFDSQISSIRTRPSPLPFRLPSSPPTLPPLALSSPVAHPHSHLSPAVSLPSVESLSYTSPPSQASALAPPPIAPATATSSAIDHFRPGMSPMGFEEFGEFREMMGFFPEQNSDSPSLDQPTVRPRHQSLTPPNNPERPHVDRPFRRPPSRQMPDGIERDLISHSRSSDRRSAVFIDSDDFGRRPVVPSMQGRGPLDPPRSRLDSSLLANRLRRSMQNQGPHTSLGRMSPPRFPSMTPSQVELSSPRFVNNSRAQELERFSRLSRGRQRINHASDNGPERSRSPVAGTFSSSTSPAYDDWFFNFPEFASPGESHYGLDLSAPPSWFDEEHTPSRPSISSSRIQRDPSTSRQAPWRSSLPSNDMPDDRILTYLSLLHRAPGTAPPGEATQSDPVWRRISPYVDYRSPHFHPSRTSSGHGDGAIDTPSTRAPHATELSSSNTTSLDVGPGWRRNLVHAESPSERPSVSMREFIDRHLHLQPPSRIPPNDPSTRRPTEVYQSVQPPEVGDAMAIDADAFRSDESPEVPFSSHAAALFASRATPSTIESQPLRRPNATDLDASPYYPWVSRFEEEIAMTTSRRRSNHGERRHHASPEPERPSTSRRVPVADPPTPSVTASRPIDLEEFQQGPFRATLERLERRELQEQQIIIERQAEIDRLRSRLDELQSLERSVTSSRVPTLPPLRFDRELVASDSPHRLSSPTPPAITDTLSFRPDSEATHRRRSWQRGRGTRPSWLHHSEEPVPWRSSSGLPPSSAPLPIPRTHSPPRPLYESRNTRPTPERERERRRRPEILELWGPEDVDDSLDSLVASPLGDGSFFTRNLARIRGELPSTDVQQPRREPHSSSPWNLDPGRPTSREPHADALRGIRPLWATHALGPWGTEVREEILSSGSNAGASADTTSRGRRRQSGLPSHGRNVSEDERSPAGRRASSTSRYAAARRAIRDPLFERVQRMVRGSPRESGFFGRYGRRNPGDFIRDEDFDTSYESLLSLAATIGEVRPRHTPDHVIDSLPTSTFKEWRNAESDQRCPICLDDYQEDDPVMKLSDCPHWLHKGCLRQWLRGATTCPVCRQRVRGPQPSRRERLSRVESQLGGSSRGGERSAHAIGRDIREQVRRVFPDIAAASRTETGPSGSGSDGEREVEQEDGDVVSMSLDWGIADAI